MPLPTIEATLKTLYELARDSLKKEESIFLNINIFLDTLRIEVNKEPNIINPDLEIIVILTCLARLARRLVDEGCNLANEIAHLPVDHKGMISRRNYKQFVGTTLRAYAATKQTEKIVQILSANRFYPENYRDAVSNVSSVIKYEKSLQDYSFYELVGHYPEIHVNQDELLHEFIRTLNDVSVGNDPVLYKCKPLLMSFLSDLKKQYYFSRIDKIKLFVDIIQLLENPYKINQGKRNVCGPAAILMLYLKNDPESCLLSFFELLETGTSKRSIPLSASYASAYLDNTFVDVYCSAIKNASNKMGYYPQFFFNLLEPFTGISEPAVLCSWLASCGFRETIEAFEVEKSNSPLQWYHERLSTNGVYSNVHKQFATKDESIKAAITEGQIKELIMLLSPSLLRIIQKQNSEDNKTEEILNIPINHYVVAKEISLTDSNNVSLVIWTYGIEYKAEIPYSDFLNGYHGFLATRPPAILAIECNANNVVP